MAFPSFPFLLSLSYYFLAHAPPQIGQTGKLISMIEGSNNAFPPKEVPLWDLIEKILVYGVKNPQKPPRRGRGLWFPSQLGESIKTHI
jgi:hypothetical protein